MPELAEVASDPSDDPPPEAGIRVEAAVARLTVRGGHTRLGPRADA